MKTPPQNTEAERVLLGSIMLDRSIYDETRLILTDADFFSSKHQAIYKASGEADGDILAVLEVMKEHGTLESSGGMAYLSGLTDIIPSKSDTKRHAKIIKEASRKRRFISRAGELIATCYGGHAFENIAAELEKEAFELSSELGGSDEAEHIGDIIQQTIARVERISNSGQTDGVMSGLLDFDRMTSGFQPDDLVIIAARPSMGKTALVFNMMQNTAKNGCPSGVFSLEMGTQALGDRMLSGATKLNSKTTRNGWINEKDWPCIAAAGDMFNNLPLFIDDTPALHISEMRSRARRMKRKHNIGLIAVDYLQLARGDGGNREQEVSHISRELKAMAKELHIPVVALAQLNRGLESRADKRPVLSDLRESGAIEQDADVITFIYRDDYYNKDQNNPKKGIAELIIGKQRNGPTGTVELGWQEETATFFNLER